METNLCDVKSLFPPLRLSGLVGMMADAITVPIGFGFFGFLEAAEAEEESMMVVVVTRIPAVEEGSVVVFLLPEGIEALDFCLGPTEVFSSAVDDSFLFPAVCCCGLAVAGVEAVDATRVGVIGVVSVFDLDALVFAEGFAEIAGDAARGGLEPVAGLG